MSRLIIYYDNPNEPSDMYLKWLKNDCEKINIEYNVVENYDMLLEEFRKDKDIKVLPMLPLEDERIFGFLRMHDYIDIDNVGKSGFYTDATATGIFRHIKGIAADRGHIITVIGRGKVGKALIDMLIEYGYTVFEFNSRSCVKAMFDVCYNCATNIIVGLSSENVFDNIHSEILAANGKILIDASNTFDTKNKLRCGKWTREVLLSRV